MSDSTDSVLPHSAPDRISASSVRRGWLVGLLGLVATVALVACGSDSGGGSPAEVTATDVPPGAVVVDVVTSARSVGEYLPKEASVPVGATVAWPNKSNASHNVVFKDGSLPSSKLYGEGRVFSATFDKAGRFPYRCTIHPGMDGTLVVG